MTIRFCFEDSDKKNKPQHHSKIIQEMNYDSAIYDASATSKALIDSILEMINKNRDVFLLNLQNVLIRLK
jgi:hypothetical protein